MTMKTETSFKSQRVSGSKTGPLENWIFQKSLSNLDDLGRISCNFKSVFSGVSGSCNNVFIAIKFGFEVRHEGDLREVDISENFLKNDGAFWSLNGNESIIIKKLNSGQKFLSFDNLIQVSHDDVLVGSVDDDSDGFLLWQDGGDTVINNSALFVQEHTQVALIDSVFGMS